jgi:geranylgeranyl pyrophosphate synthase
MRNALKSIQSERGSLEWWMLPILCCQAAGGSAQAAIPVAAAWRLFYAAAHIMDSVEDRDEPEAWWAEMGPGTGISAATGLYFSASLALERLEERLDRPGVAREIRIEMLKRFIEMSSGQHMDLIQRQPNLETYWRIARAKSGAFFSMACWAGARVATDQTETLLGYQQFGLHIGLLIQVLDDLKDFQNLAQLLQERGPAGLTRTLPVVYVLELSAGEERERFWSLLAETRVQTQRVEEIVQMIERNGGALYLYTELESHRQQALQGLDQVDAQQTYKRRLLSFLDELHAPE